MKCNNGISKSILLTFDDFLPNNLVNLIKIFHLNPNSQFFL